MRSWHTRNSRGQEGTKYHREHPGRMPFKLELMMGQTPSKVNFWVRNKLQNEKDVTGARETEIHRLHVEQDHERGSQEAIWASRLQGSPGHRERPGREPGSCPTPVVSVACCDKISR